MNSLEPNKTETKSEGMQDCIRYAETSKQLKDMCDQNDAIANTEYYKAIRAAFADFEKDKLPFCVEFEKKKRETLPEYEVIIQVARKEYLRIKSTSGNLSTYDYLKIIQPAQAECDKAEAVLADYKKKIEAEYCKMIEPFLSAYIQKVNAAKAEFNAKSAPIHYRCTVKKMNAWLEFCSKQDKKISEYFEKWLAIGLRTEPLNRENVLPLIKAFYRNLDKNEPEIIICDSPLSCLHKIIPDKRVPLRRRDPQLGPKKETALDKRRKAIMGRSISPERREHETLEIRSKIEWSVKQEIRNHISGGISTRLQGLISSQIMNHLESIRNENCNWWFGNSDCHWAGYYEFYKDVFGLKPDEPVLFNILIAMTKELHWFLPYEKVCVVSDFPVAIHKNQNGLHKNGAPALRYKDGMSVWALNGVRVSQVIAETPADKLDAQLLLKEPNIDIRREIVRKIGIERVCRDLGAKTIDRETNYELLLLNIGEHRRVPYLKMLNPSIGVYHIEGVPPGTKTVKQALFWRNQSDEKPNHLT